MHILMVLTYYQPYKSGQTVYAVRQAKALATLGHRVTVLTSQYDPKLPLDESDDGVRIVRLPILFHLSKGVIMPAMPFRLWKLIGDADIIHLHVPQFESGLVALIAKIRGKPLTITYHCDLDMPGDWFSRLAGWMTQLMHRISAGLADAIVHNTRDYAEHSSFLNRYLDKLTVIQPPIINAPLLPESVREFKEKFKIAAEQPVIGMVARLATEKGVEYLVDAMPHVLEVFPQARVIFVGMYMNVPGEERYRQKLMPMIEGLGEHWTFSGVISEKEKSAFYKVCDVLVLPSINRTESFGMVQVEAMMCGASVIATDMPGVRQPVRETGMGFIVPTRDVSALADAIIKTLSSKMSVETESIAHLNQFYAPETVARAYETLFMEILEKHG